MSPVSLVCKYMGSPSDLSMILKWHEQSRERGDEKNDFIKICLNTLELSKMGTYEYIYRNFLYL